MAVIEETAPALEGISPAKVRQLKWIGLTFESLRGEWIRVPEYVDKTVQITGTIDGATVAIQGTNVDEGMPDDAIDGLSLRDINGNLLEVTTLPFIATIAESSTWIRPVVTGAGGGTDVTVRIIGVAEPEPSAFGLSLVSGGVIITPPDAATIPLILKGFPGQTASLQEWQDSNGDALVIVAGDLTSLLNILVTGTTTLNGPAVITSQNAVDIGLVVRGAGSQSANLQEWQNSAGLVRSRINANGALFLSTAGQSPAVTITDTTTQARLLLTQTAVTTGVRISLNRLVSSTDFADLQFTTGGSGNWGVGMQPGTSNFSIEDNGSSSTAIAITSGTPSNIALSQIELKGRQARNVESQTLGAGAATFAVTKDVIKLTGDAGSNTITTITGGLTGQVLYILFQDALVTMSDNGAPGANQLALAGNMTGSVDDTLTLMYNGTYWQEITRSVN